MSDNLVDDVVDQVLPGNGIIEDRVDLSARMIRNRRYHQIAVVMRINHILRIKRVASDTDRAVRKQQVFLRAEIVPERVYLAEEVMMIEVGVMASRIPSIIIPT